MKRGGEAVAGFCNLICWITIDPVGLTFCVSIFDWEDGWEINFSSRSTESAHDNWLNGENCLSLIWCACGRRSFRTSVHVFGVMGFLRSPHCKMYCVYQCIYPDGNANLVSGASVPCFRQVLQTILCSLETKLSLKRPKEPHLTILHVCMKLFSLMF